MADGVTLRPRGGEDEVSGVLSEVREERKRQDEKWGGPAHDDLHSGMDWVQLLGERQTKILEAIHHGDRIWRLRRDLRSGRDDVRKQAVILAALAATSGVVRGVQFSTVAKRSDAGPKTIAGAVRQGGVNYFGAARTPSTIFTVEDNRDILELNPATGLVFTIAEVNADEFGFTVNS